MIQNLNQLTFRQFGTILADKDASSGGFGAPYPLMIFDKNLPIFRTAAQTKILCEREPVVLAVRRGQEPEKTFYLDKPVVLNPDVEFYLSALNGSARGMLWTQLPPKQIGIVDFIPRLHMKSRLQVKKIYTFFYQEKEQGFLFSGETHNMPELVYVDQGTLHSVADGQDLLLRQGDMVLYMPGQWHMQYADIGVAPRFVNISFEVEGLDYQSLTNRVLPACQNTIDLLKQMLREQEQDDEYAEDMIISLLNQVLVNMLRNNLAQAPLRSTHCMNNENTIISRAQQYISSNVRQKLSVPLVAQNADVSPSYLTALFHKHLQISPGEYIRRIKLQESKQMIREGNMNFTQIAQTLQYSTIHHFSRQFKEKFGMTPSEYAKSIK